MMAEYYKSQIYKIDCLFLLLFFVSLISSEV